jgi:hypothetical protein
MHMFSHHIIPGAIVPLKFYYFLMTHVASDWWYSTVNTTIKIKINQSNCSHCFYLIVAACFGPHMGLSSGSLIKYVLCYLTDLIGIHISATHHSHIIHATAMKLQEFF